MSAKSKMDMLDFIINVLIEHEKKLDLLIQKLERNTDLIQDMIRKEKLMQAT